jgi:hypothetical protein
VLASAAGAVALMPGLRSVAANATSAASAAAAQMAQLLGLLQTPEQVVANSELLTVPAALQAALAKLAAAAQALGGARIALPAAVQAELMQYLRLAGGAGKDVLVPAGSTGVVFSPDLLASIKASQ